MTNRRRHKGLAILIMFCFLVGIPGNALAFKTPDNQPPQLNRSSVIGSILTLDFDELLKAIPARDPGLFSVKVNGTPQAQPQSAVVAIKSLAIKLADTVKPGDQVTISYQSGNRGIEDLAGNKTATFNDFSVKNLTPDLNPPQLQEAIANGADLCLSYNEALNESSVPNNMAYSILINGQQTFHPDTISITGAKINLHLLSALIPEDQVKISYASIIHPVKDLAGNPALPLILHPVRNITGQDLTPPVVVEASIDKDNIKLTFNEELDAVHLPPVTAFKVQVGANEQMPTTVTLDGCCVNLLLGSSVASTDTVNLSYVLSDTNLCDRAGNEVAPFTAMPVVNNTPPVSQNPEIISAVAKDKTITLTYSKPLKPELLPALLSFAIKITNRDSVTPVQVIITEAQLTLALAQTLKARDALTLSYTPGENPVQDLEGNLAPAQNDYPVQNQTEGDITPPILEETVINGSSVSLVYNEEIDITSVPDVTDFAVHLDQVTQIPYEVQINQKGITLNLETSAKQGQACYLDYTPGVHPLSDLSGNPAPSLHMQPLNNLTTTLAAPPLDPVYPSSLEESTSFIYEGEKPVQTGVAMDTIVADRVFLIRGIIKDRDDMTLSGVKVTIAQHPEFGETISRSDGAYDMVVNGGGVLTLSYEKEGYIPVQRVIESAWEKITCLEDIVLVPYDPNPNPINLGNSEIQVAQGSVSTDQDGQRQATLVIPSGTSAKLQLEDGSTSPLSTATIRATELTVGENGPEAMPADLPGNVGYTYAVDFSVDEVQSQGAGQIAFDRPIYNYVENFLDFPVGGSVPAAYYDPDKVAWIPSQNGRIIKILAIENEEAQLDISGSGNPATAEELAALGCDQAELRQLATLYTVGKSLWRVPITHFSTWDYNWPFGPPADARAPGLPLLSDIPLKTQILGRSQEITGTPFDLYYSSERMPGYQSVLKIPLSGETLPASLKSIHLEIQVAGQKITPPDFAPLPNQTYDFRWNGLDAYGRTLNTPQECTVKIGYVYPGQYQSPGGRFGDFSGIPMTGNGERLEVTLWQEMTTALQPPQSCILAAQKLGGWTLSPCHAFDPVNEIIYLGYGLENNSKQIGQIINTIGGNGYQPTSSGLAAGFTESRELVNRGANPADTRPNMIYDVAVCNDGTIYASDAKNNQIYKCTLPDHWEVVAGTGEPGFSGDGGPATSASLNAPSMMDLAPDGSLLFVDGNNYRIRKIDSNGLISTVAGNGEDITYGDGGPAIAAAIGVSGVATDTNGNIYIADYFGNSVRRISPDGIISTVAKGNFPQGIDVAQDGSVYYCDCGGIFCIKPNGVIEKVAGIDSGYIYPLGDGGLATDAFISDACDIKVMDDGSYIFSDTNASRIRKVESDGIISSIAGSISDGEWLEKASAGEQIPSGDYGRAAGGTLVNPYGIDVSPNGTIYVAQVNHFYQQQLDGYWDYGLSYDGNVSSIRCICQPNYSAINGVYQVPSQDGSEVYSFDEKGRHLATYDALSGSKKFDFVYNEQGLSQITDRDGKVTNIRREADKIIIDGYGQQNELQLNPEGYIRSIKDPMGYTTSFSYDNNGMMTVLNDKNNHQCTYTYDGQGRLQQTRQPDGASITMDGQTEGKMAQVVATTAMGKTSTSRMEESGNGDKIATSISSSGATSQTTRTSAGSTTGVSEDGTVYCSQEGPDPRWGMAAPILKTSSVTTPGGLVKGSSYDVTVTLQDPSNPMSLQSLTSTTTVNGKTGTEQFNKANGGSGYNTLTTTSPQGRIVLESLNDKDRVVKTEMAGIEPVSYEYYSGEHEGLLRETRQGGRVTSYTYDSLDRLASVSDTLGNTTSYTYNNDNQMISMTMPDGGRYQYHYDPSGLCDQIIMPDGAIHAMSYTVANLDESYTPPGNSPYVNQYDQDQYPTQIKLPSGKLIRTEYYPDGRPSKLIYDSNQISLSYKGSTDLVQEVAVIPNGGSPSTSIQYNYDGSLLTSQLTSGPGQGGFNYRYNNDFLLAGITLNGGPETLFQYDNDGLLIAEGSFNIKREGPAGSVSEITDGSLLTTFQYNSYGQLWRKSVSVAGQQVYLLELGYDQTGRINSKTETSGTEHHSYSYTYDANDQLQSVARDGAPYENYQYDQNGNRISTIIAGEEKTAIYDQQDRLQKLGDTDYQFDQDGFLQKIGETSYTYSAVGELQSITTAEGQTTYQYDGTARRVARADEAGSSEYLYGNPDEDYEISAVRRPGGQIDEYTYDPTGILQSIKRDGQIYYVACDNLGSPKIITDSGGNVIKALEYDSYGRLITDSNPGFTIAVGYAAGLDDHNGLIRFGARDYDPDTGRWTAKDPLLFEGGQGNLYAYVANDPVNKTDPEGTFAVVLVPVVIELSGEVIAAIAGIATAVVMAANKDSIYKATSKENNEKAGPIGKKGLKKQGREGNEKKKIGKNKKWEPNPNKNINRPMKKHTPKPDHQKK